VNGDEAESEGLREGWVLSLLEGRQNRREVGYGADCSMRERREGEARASGGESGEGGRSGSARREGEAGAAAGRMMVG
jgi:hypothetical protein